MNRICAPLSSRSPSTWNKYTFLICEMGKHTLSIFRGCWGVGFINRNAFLGCKLFNEQEASQLWPKFPGQTLRFVHLPGENQHCPAQAQRGSVLAKQKQGGGHPSPLLSTGKRPSECQLLADLRTWPVRFKIPVLISRQTKMRQLHFLPFYVFHFSFLHFNGTLLLPTTPNMEAKGLRDSGTRARFQDPAGWRGEKLS